LQHAQCSLATSLLSNATTLATAGTTAAIWKLTSTATTRSNAARLTRRIQWREGTNERGTEQW
jgi:hypothetical protein